MSKWKGKMTAKAAYKLGYISQEEYLKLRREEEDEFAPEKDAEKRIVGKKNE